jgi:hypothetical protein
MSFKSREKKRRAKLAINQTRAEYRETMASRYYLTIVSRHCCCNGCGGSLRKGREAVYRHTPCEILCLPCAEDRKIPHRPSLRWEKYRKRVAAPVHGQP